jgi:lamin B
MASKQTRQTASKTEMRSPSATPMTRRGPDASFFNDAPIKSSPSSPSHMSRLKEKEDLQNLNDRLACYIDTVRKLEAENVRLQNAVHQYSETSTRDVSEIKALFERELEDSKRLIDDLAKEKAKLEIDLSRYKSDAEETSSKYVLRGNVEQKRS